MVSDEPPQFCLASKNGAVISQAWSKIRRRLCWLRRSFAPPASNPALESTSSICGKIPALVNCLEIEPAWTTTRHIRNRNPGDGSGVPSLTHLVRLSRQNKLHKTLLHHNIRRVNHLLVIQSPTTIFLGNYSSLLSHNTFLNFIV